MYGKGATYDSIEGQFRKIKTLAAQLQTENGGDEVLPAPKTPRKPRTPNKKKATVISGRIEKDQCVTPTKKKKQDTTSGVREEVDSSGSSFVEGVMGIQFDEMAGYEWGNVVAGELDGEEI